MVKASIELENFNPTNNNACAESVNLNKTSNQNTSILSSNSSLSSLALENSLPSPFNENPDSESIILKSKFNLRPENLQEENVTQKLIQEFKQKKRPLGPRQINDHVVYCKNLKSLPRFQNNLTLHMDNWNGVNIFNLTELTNGRPMTTLFWSIMEKQDLINHFKINKRKLLCWLLHVEDHYRDLPYHNRQHSADVLHSTHAQLGNSV